MNILPQHLEQHQGSYGLEARRVIDSGVQASRLGVVHVVERVCVAGGVSGPPRLAKIAREAAEQRSQGGTPELDEDEAMQLALEEQLELRDSLQLPGRQD